MRAPCWAWLVAHGERTWHTWRSAQRRRRNAWAACPVSLPALRGRAKKTNLISVVVNLLNVDLVEMHQTLLVVLPYVVLQRRMIQHRVHPEALDFRARFDPFCPRSPPSSHPARDGEGGRGRVGRRKGGEGGGSAGSTGGEEGEPACA